MSLPFHSATLLAPMEGVTEPVFRELVLARNPPDALGGAFTEFLRVTDHPIRAGRIRRHLGKEVRVPLSDGTNALAVVGLQLMGADTGALAETTRRAFAAGAPLVDLNFGCPAKGALRGCAGSALLDEPGKVEELVRRCVEAGAGRPVSAKIRAGGEDDALLEELARAVEEAGAALLTVHCRTRAEGYRGSGDWERIARAVAATRLPVCGNGGVERHADIARMRAETGCALVMVGRAALGDPWVFRGARASAVEAAGFLLEYAARLADGGAGERKVLGRLKQLLAVWRAGGIVDDEARGSWLTERELGRVLARLSGLAREGSTENEQILGRVRPVG